MPLSTIEVPSPLRATRHTSRRSFVAVRFFLAAAVLLAVIATLAPFESSFSQAELVTRFQDGAITSRGDLLKLGAHFVVFFCLGCLVVCVYENSLPTAGFWRFAMLAVLFCGALELAQFFQLSRHARVVDFICNSAGLILGMRAAISWQPLRACRLVLQRQAQRLALPLHGAVLVIATTLWSLAGLRPLMGSLAMDWDSSYPLVIANEADGSRPWLGQIQYIGIYDRALDRAEVSSAFARQQEFRPSGLLVGYDFAKAGPELRPEGSLNSAELTLHIPSNFIREDRGIVLNQGTVLATSGPASALTKAITTSGAFSVEAWVRPANQAQTGPARIVGISDGIWRRNFTLGQEDSSAVFRVRNITNGSNGANQALQVDQAIQVPLQHLVAVYDHGVSAIFRDGRPLSPVRDLRETSLILGLGPGPLGRLAAGILLTLLVALPVYALLGVLKVARARHAAAMLFVLTIGFLPYALSCLLFGGPWRSEFFLWVGAGLLAAYPLCYLYVNKRGAGSAELGSKMIPF